MTAQNPTQTFSVQFHQPFLIGSGRSGRGLDEIARTDHVLPAESLKGAMRAAARLVLGIPDPLVEAVFGTGGTVRGAVGQGAWAWTDAGPESSFIRHSRPRNRIDTKTRTVVAEALAFTEEIWQRTDATVEFLVEPLRALPDPETSDHVAILQASAYAVTGLGQSRNRSMGAVTIRPKPPIDAGRIAATIDRLTGGAA